MQPVLAPRFQATAQDHVSDQILREQLLSQAQSSPSPRDHPDAMQQVSSSPSPNNLNHADAAAGSGVMSNSADSDGGETGGDGRKGYGKRELSTSKRAAQNRAAQRAFRQRKEGYIKKLEEQVRDYTLLNENYTAVQEENYQLRDYIIGLQSRLLESQGEFPPPPSNVDGLHPGRGGQPIQHNRHIAPTPTPTHIATPGITAINQLRGATEQVNSESSTFSVRSPVEVHHQQHAESPAAKRPRIGAQDMNPAQEALQGIMGPGSPLRAGNREEVPAGR